MDPTTESSPVVPVVCQHCTLPIEQRGGTLWVLAGDFDDFVCFHSPTRRHEPVVPVGVEEREPATQGVPTGRKQGPSDLTERDHTGGGMPVAARPPNQCPACEGPLEADGTHVSEFSPCVLDPVGIVEQPEAPTHHHVGLEECPACVAAQAAENAEHAEPVVQPVDGPPSCPGCKMPLEQSQEGRWHHRSGGTIQRRCPLWDAPDIQPALPVDPRPTREAPTREAIRAALRDWWLNDDASGGPDSDVDGMMRVLDELGALRVASESHPTRLVAARLPYDEDQFPQRLKFSLVKDGGFWITIRRHPGGPPEWVAADELIEVPS